MYGGKDIVFITNLAHTIYNIIIIHNNDTQLVEHHAITIGQYPEIAASNIAK